MNNSIFFLQSLSGNRIVKGTIPVSGNESVFDTERALNLPSLILLFTTSGSLKSLAVNDLVRDSFLLLQVIKPERKTDISN